jgi:hypothetical protein
MSSLPLSSAALASILGASDASSPLLRESASSPSPFDFGGSTDDASSWLSEPAFKWGPSVVLIRDPSAICGGRVGQTQNNCFCIGRPNDGTAKGCRVGKHTVDKHPTFLPGTAWLSSRVFFHKGAGRAVAIAEPWVDTRSLSTQEITALLARKFTSWEAWQEEATVYQSAAASDQDVSLIQTAVKATKEVPRQTREGKRLFSTKKEEGAALQDLETKLRLLGSVVDELMRSKMLDWEVRTDEEMDEQTLVVRELVERVRLVQEALVTLSDVSVGGLRELQLGVVVRLTALEGILGSLSNCEGVSRFEGATFASAICHLQEQMDVIKEDKVTRDVVGQVMKSNDMMEFAEGLKDAFKKMMRKVLVVEESMEQLKLRESNQTHSYGGATAVSTGIRQNWLGDVESSVELGQDDKSIEQEGVSEDFKSVLTSLAQRVDAMEQAGGLNSKMEGEDISVFFMGVRFASERDVRAYVISKSHASFVLPVGLVTDCYSIFYELNREIFDSKNKLGVTDLAKVAQLAKKQADVYNILAGVEHGLPDFFDPPSSATKVYIDGRQGTKKHRFGNIPSYDIWGPVGTDGFTIRKKAKGILTRLVTTRKNEIKDQVKNEKLQSFLLQMLDMSKDFVFAVFSFLTEEYAALYQHFDDSALCWDFACSCVEHVFKHEFEAARAVVRNPDVVDDSISIKILWQSLRTIAVQETFMRVGFKNHSSLASAYSKFLLTQYQRSAGELSKVSREMEACRKMCVDMASRVEALEKRLKSAEGTANAAQNALQKLKRNGD